MPAMGESVSEGTVLEWHVSEGDTVEEGQTIVEVSTDKVDAEVPAPADGKITEILVQPDETVDVGAALAKMESGDQELTEAAAEQPEAGNGGPPEAEQGESAPEAEQGGSDSGAATTDDT